MWVSSRKEFPGAIAASVNVLRQIPCLVCSRDNKKDSSSRGSKGEGREDIRETEERKIRFKGRLSCLVRHYTKVLLL